MKIIFTGGGSGGHFYPLIAIAKELNRISHEERLIAPQLFFMAPEPYNRGLLFEAGITYLPISAGKLRRYFSLRNLSDLLKTGWGILNALFIVFRIFPDVVVGKGGFGSFPALLAARLFGIPVLIHESDATPGRVNAWAGKFARRIAVSFKEAGEFFPPARVAQTGNPIRPELLLPASAAGERFLAAFSRQPLIFVLGGSLGSVTLNEALFKILPDLLASYAVVHQAGVNNVADIAARAAIALSSHPNRDHYRPIGYLSTAEMAAAGQRAALIISRAGSTLFEIAAWGKPSILVPITDSNGDHQRANAYAYALGGAAAVIEEANLTPAILKSEIERILGDAARSDTMSAAARNFAKVDAAEIIAREIITLALKHESV